MTHLDKLIEANDCKHKHDNGTGVVLVGHHESKIRKAIKLYEQTKPSDKHDFIVVSNGNKITGIPNTLHRQNTGWDIAMYAEAVMHTNHSYYWFMNDDVITIKDNTYLAEALAKLRTSDAVFVQLGTPRNFRTTYFGCTRLFFLMWYVAIHYGILKKHPITIRSHERASRIKKRVPGFIQAQDFEMYNLTFAKIAARTVSWLNDSEHFVDVNADRRPIFKSNVSSRLTYDMPRPGLIGFGNYDIESLWQKHCILTIEELIKLATECPNPILDYTTTAGCL